MADRARELGIELIQPEDLNAPSAVASIAAAEPDAVLVCAYGAIIREPLLSAHDTYNVHPSLLPRWRGAAPVERAIQAGDPETGVCIMRPTAELDAGPGAPARLRADPARRRLRQPGPAAGRPGRRGCSCRRSTSGPSPSPRRRRA